MTGTDANSGGRRRSVISVRYAMAAAAVTTRLNLVGGKTRAASRADPVTQESMNKLDLVGRERFDTRGSKPLVEIVVCEGACAVDCSGRTFMVNLRILSTMG